MGVDLNNNYDTEVCRVETTGTTSTTGDPERYLGLGYHSGNRSVLHRYGLTVEELGKLRTEIIDGPVESVKIK